MGKRIFWIFILTVALVTTVAVIYLQSEGFARILKRQIQAKVSTNFGVGLNFDRLKIGVFPPSISMVNVDLEVLQPDNKLGLASDTIFKAGSLGFSFRMIQAFSSGITVNKVFLNEAQVKLMLPKGKGEGNGEKLSALVHKPIRIELSDRFFLSIRQLELRNTMLDLSWRDAGQISRIVARNVGYLAVTPLKEGTNLVLNLEDIELHTPKINESIKVIKANADVQRDLILLSTLDVQRHEAALHASGKLVGSIDKLEDGRPDIDLIFRGPFSEFADLDKRLTNFNGEILADVKIVGRIRNPDLQGKLEITGFHHEMWSVEKIEAAGSYGSGVAVLDSMAFFNGGGKVSLRNKLEVPLPLRPDPMAFQLRFENAKFEDFNGNLKRSVNNLRLQLDGLMNLRLELLAGGDAGKIKLGSISMRPELTIKDLELNNQAYGKTRPYRRIFKVAPFQLVGNLQWKQEELHVSDTKFAFASGVMDVSGTFSDRGGFNLMGSAPSINLGKEAGEISGIPLSGEGAFAVSVHGPDSNVKIDFDLDQKNSKFLNFDFGALEGRVTYDDKDSYLQLVDVNGKKGGARYSVNGRVDLDDTENISLAASFDESAPDDIFSIFAHQLQKITWIPHGMTGAIKGGVKVGGRYSDGLSTLEIDSRLTGKNLSYKGEMVHELTAHAGVKKGVAFAHEIRAKKYDTPFEGEIDYNLKTDEMKYSLEASRGKLRSLDFLSSLGMPLDGLYSFHSEGQGKWETLVSASKLDVTNAFLRTRPLPAFSINFDTLPESSTLVAKFGPSAKFSASFGRGPHDDSSAALSLEKTNLDFLLCWLSRANCTDPALSFTASAAARFNWKGWDWHALSGSGSLQEVLLAKTGYSLRMPSPVPITASAGLIETGNGTLEGEESRIGFHFQGKVDGTSLDNTLKGSSSLKVLEFLTPIIEEARGRLRLDLGLGGNVKNGSFRGSLTIEEGLLRLSGLEAPLDRLDARFKLSDSKVAIDHFNGQLGGGTVNATGEMDIYLDRPPHFDIELFLANNRTKFFPVNYAEISDAKLGFSGDAPPYLFSGSARIKRVMMHNNFDLGHGQKGLQNARYLPEKVAGVKSFYEVRIRAVAESGIFVENNLLNAEFRGELTLMNNFEFPQVVGRAELVRGKLLFRNTGFTLDHALIRLPNPEIVNPQFSIGGVANVDNYRISIFASGTLDKRKITLASYPSLPQEDIVSLLAFGYRGEDARKVNPNDTTAITYSEVGSILLEQLQLSQNLQSKGLRLTVAPALSDSEVNLIRPNNTMATAAPKVYVQTQIVKNLEAAFGGTVGAAQGQSMDAKLEYRLGRKASVSAIYEQAPSGLDAAETKNSYGADLKFRWGFK